MKATVHCFEIEDAKKYGVECAVILYNIRHWLDKNKANKKHDYDGRVWTYNSAKAFAELFPYLTQRQIYNRLSKLEESGLLISGNFNKAGYDRTKWYSLNEVSYAILLNGEMDLPKRSNAFTESVEPIPDINTNINTDKNNYVGFEEPRESESFLIAERVSNYLYQCILNWDATHKYHHNKPSLDSWVKDIERAIRLDGRTEEQLNYIIEAVFIHFKKLGVWDGWASNIQSGKKLRDQFDTIKNQIKTNADNKPKNNGDKFFDMLRTNYD